MAIHIVNAINQQLIQAKVDLALQVGDLTDKGTAAGLNTRAAHDKALAAAEIPFYPLRGNHEGKLEAAAWFSKAFPKLPGTPGNGGSSPALAGAAGRTYSFVHKGVKFILLDEFTLTESNKKGYSMADYQPWINQDWLRRTMSTPSSWRTRTCSGKATKTTSSATARTPSRPCRTPFSRA